MDDIGGNLMQAKKYRSKPVVIEIEYLPISTNAYSDPMYGFVAYCDKDFVQKLSGKKWKAVFTEVIE